VEGCWFGVEGGQRGQRRLKEGTSEGCGCGLGGCEWKRLPLNCDARLDAGW
jgi:hypothetical protein